MPKENFDPVKEFVNLRDNITKSVGQGLKNVAGTNARFPAMDIYETEDAVFVRTEPLIGIVAASIEVSMEDDTITIVGETYPDVEIQDEAFLLRELSFGSFSRSATISRRVKPNEAKASLTQGILTVKIPKEESVQIIEITPE
jgi:HSP20 family protein